MPKKKTVKVITGEPGQGMSYLTLEVTEEKGCWNCKWEALEIVYDPCYSCILFDKWEM